MSKTSASGAPAIDFDRVRDWGPRLRTALSGCVSDATISKVARTKLEFVEDARDLLFELAGRDAVIDATLTWLSSSDIVAYHGSRLTDDDIRNIRTNGLVPLAASARRPRLERALSSHPDWRTVQTRLDQVLNDLGQNNLAGRREGQVHLTLSRAGLTNNFNHYLTHGAEFDQHAATDLLGEDGKALLAKDGKRTLIQAALTGDNALRACHRYFSVDDLRRRGDVPNLVNEILKAWSFRLFRPRFDPRTLGVDCGFVFNEDVPASWIREIELLPD